MQTAYQIQVANSPRGLDHGDLLWDSGKVWSGAQSGVPYAGEELSSREQRLLACPRLGCPRRALGVERSRRAGRWGSCGPSDWGSARWIEYPGRTETQPLPIFARKFDVRRKVASARLYLSGIGLHLATVNGETLTDEVLAPGNSNYQLSSEYRMYDITDALDRGSNTVGVQLGNGTAYVRRSVTNPAVGRTSPYSWWQSQLKGSGTLTEAAPAGATNVRPSSTTNYHIGGTINIDTGERRRRSRVAGHHGDRHSADHRRGTERHLRHARPVADRRQLDLERRRSRHE